MNFEKISFFNEKEKICRTKDGRNLHILSGYINGNIKLEKYTEIAGEDAGLYEIKFIFRPKNYEKNMMHKNVLSAYSLWVPKETTVMRDAPNFCQTLDIFNFLNKNRNITFPYNDGGLFEITVLEFSAAKYQIQVNKEDVGVKLSFSRYKQKKPSEIKSIYYKVKYENILWRKMPKYYSDDISPEDINSNVDIEIADDELPLIASDILIE